MELVGLGKTGMIDSCRDSWAVAESTAVLILAALQCMYRGSDLSMMSQQAAVNRVV